MTKVMVFGKPAGGKSTLSKKLAEETGLPLYSLDLLAYDENGQRQSAEIYSAQHQKLIKSEAWIIEGLGTLDSFWARVRAADVLIYIDLPYSLHYWWVLKRLILSPFRKPEGWPEGASILKGTLLSLKYLRMSRTFWTEDLLNEIEKKCSDKRFFKIKSVSQLKTFRLT